MKQYTSKDQTAKLIELGFPKPQSIVDVDVDYSIRDHTIYNAYSIGELIEFLQLIAENNDVRISTQMNLVSFDVMTKEGRYGYSSNEDELIDSLYEVYVIVKEGLYS